MEIREQKKRVINSLLMGLIAILLVIGSALQWRNVKAEDTSLANLSLQALNAYQALSLDEAIIKWQRALELNPNQLQVRYNLAQALDSTGAITEAIIEYQEMIELAPQLVTPRYNLAALYWKQGKPDDALELIDAAVKLAPYFAASRMMRAAIYQQQGDLSGALVEYQAVIDLSNDSDLDLANIYFAMGNIYYSLQFPEQARKAWQKTLELQPGHSGAIASIQTLPAVD